MKKLLFVSLMAFTMSIVSINVSAEPVKLKFASFPPPKAVSNTVVFIPWIKKVNAEGTVNIEIFMGGVLGRGELVYKHLQAGVADIAFIVQEWISGQFPDDGVLNLPFMAKNGKESCLVSYDLYKKGLLRGYEDIKVLAVMGTGVSFLHSSFPVRTPADLERRSFAVNSSIQAELIKQLGAVGVGMTSVKVAENMSRNIVQGWIADISALFAFRVNDVAKHHLLLPFGTSTLLIAMNKKKYENLPPEAKETIDRNSGEVLGQAWAKMIDDQVEEKLAIMEKDPKHTVVVPTDKEIDQWKIAVQPVIDRWKRAAPGRDKLLKAYQDKLDQIR